ncbi:hypothetical protein RchiOBHm_Chr7g0236711 [Rosa chinensis]|uniref:Uncharacterized protein n=1 Tax=Rosa chinensis TaxID=74649 RepID=A0A2P6PH11_ROSCH|nr:hypothetical protein RchiOBHm_Chr7g0236711 [Rosa chinensis]
MFLKPLDVKTKMKIIQSRRFIIVAKSIIESMIYQIKERGIVLILFENSYIHLIYKKKKKLQNS